MIVINDSLVQEVQVFKEHTNVFDEYMFVNFYFSPMSEPQLRRVLRELLIQHYHNEHEDNPDDDRARVIYEQLPVVFDDFFHTLHHVVANDTVNINEYSYFFLMLIGQYLQPAIDVWQNTALFEERIEKRGKYLFTE